jgi:ferredoxin
MSGNKFEVHLVRKGITLVVNSDESILDVLLLAGIQAPYLCMEGSCSTCQVTVLEGTPEHRDTVLTPAQRDAQNVMMICCSRSYSPRLVLDL